MELNRLSDRSRELLGQIAARDGQAGNLSSHDLLSTEAGELGRLALSLKEDSYSATEQELMDWIITLTDTEGNAGYTALTGLTMTYDFATGHVAGMIFPDAPAHVTSGSRVHQIRV